MPCQSLDYHSIVRRAEMADFLLDGTTANKDII